MASRPALRTNLRPAGKGHIVVKFSPEGKVLLTLGKAGVAGDGPDTFNQPSDVASLRMVIFSSRTDMAGIPTRGS